MATRLLLTRRGLAAGALAALAAPAWADQASLRVAQIVDLTGAHDVIGDSWRNGVEMAVQEINDAGGLLGGPVAVTTYDGRSNPAEARRIMQHIVGQGYAAVLGPVTEDAARAAEEANRTARVPQIVGGDAPTPSPADAPPILRAAPSKSRCMGWLAEWLRQTLKPRRVALFAAPDEPFRTSRDALAHELRGHGIEVAPPIAPERPGEAARAALAGVDAAFLALPVEECVRTLEALRRLAPALPLFGDAALVRAPVIARAGPLAEGLRALVAMTPEGPTPALAGFRQRYQDRCKEPPDEPALAGYVALAVLKAAAERTDNLDRAGLATALRGKSLTAAEAPMLLLDSAWDADGDIERPCWLAEVRDGKPVAVQTLPSRS